MDGTAKRNAYCGVTKEHRGFKEARLFFSETYKKLYGNDCNFTSIDERLLFVNDLTYEKYQLDVILITMWLMATESEREVNKDE